MSLQISSRDKPVENFLTSLLEAYPDASMREIAVLFTDVVGSTAFFKTFGDLRGREMLRTHHNMAMSIVNEYGGYLIKEVGDSVLVYFPDPKEALKAAIMMQHKFSLYNQDIVSREEIHVRIGLHYGKVIIEEKDIYGDVVNVAAKLTNLAGGDQIFVSHELYNHTKDLSLTNFELINFWNMKDVPAGLTIYKVDWERSTAAPPSRNILVVIVTDPSVASSNDIVGTLTLSDTTKDLFSGGQCISTKKTENNEIVFIFERPWAALEASEKIFSFIADRSGGEGALAPVKIFITAATSQTEKTILANGAGAGLSAVPFNGIYLTDDINRDIMKHSAVTGVALPVIENLGSLYKIVRKGQNDKEPQGITAVRQTDATTGELFAPCFYCGSRKHRVMNCPSKTLTEPGRSIEQFGYLPIRKIEEIATSIERSSINIDGDKDPFPSKTPSNIDELAAYAYYDLNSLYQFRFSQVIFNSKASSWNKVSQGLIENQGGFVWLAQDSLRVSSYGKAGSFLKLALDKDPNDYKVYCVSGFLNIEKDYLSGAIDNFSKALELSRTNPQKIYSSMLLARLYKLSGMHEKARDILNSIKNIDPGCIEAVYQDAVFKFEQNDDKAALQRLTAAIRENREFFVISLIDPEVSKHRNIIYAHLFEILTGAKTAAQSDLEDAKQVFANSHKLLPPSILKNIEPLFQHIEELIASEGYFGLLDIPHHCSSIKTMCRNALKEQINNLLDIMRRLKARLEKAQAFIRSYRYPHLTEKYKKKLSYLRSELGSINDVRLFDSSEQFEACYRTCRDIEVKLSSVEGKLEMLDLSQQLIYLSFRFLKNSSIFFSIVFFLGIFVLPLMSDQLTAILAKLEFSSFPNVWALQKSFLIFGGIASLIISFSMSIKDLFKS